VHCGKWKVLRSTRGLPPVADRARRCHYQVDEGRFAISAAENNCGFLAEGERETLLANTRLELKVKKLEEENLALRD